METLRLFSLRNVQTELRITATPYAALVGGARSLPNTASEDAALGAVSSVLGAEQGVRLRELLVEDLGYNALALGSARGALDLTADPTTQVSAVLATVQSAKLAASTAADPRLAERAITAMMAQSSAALSKLLTAEQDARLRGLAGKAIGTR